MFISPTHPGVWSSESLVEALRAAGEPTRLRALALLARGELSVGELAQALDQSQPRISRHMKLLTAARLCERTTEGAWVFYRLPTTDDHRRPLAEALALAVSEDDPLIAADLERLEAVRTARAEAAQAYFAQVAADWDRVRTLHLPEGDVEAAILEAAGPGPFERMIDLGAGTGRMIALFASRVGFADGIDSSRQMLAVARAALAEAPAARWTLRLGDIYAAPAAKAAYDLAVMHQVLHFLPDPRRAVEVAVSLLRPGGRFILADFAPHELEFLRAEHAHRRLGFADAEIAAWCASAGAPVVATRTLAPTENGKLTVKIWSAQRLQGDAA